MTDEKPTLAELAEKYPCTPIGQFYNCWSFVDNRDCRKWAEEAEGYGYRVFSSLNVGGEIPNDK